MRRHARLDSNQESIVTALRAVGCEVQSLASVGSGCADLLVAFRGHWFVAEIKDGDKKLSAQKLTPDEIKWHNKFGAKARVHTWHSVKEALWTVGASG